MSNPEDQKTRSLTATTSESKSATTGQTGSGPGRLRSLSASQRSAAASKNSAVLVRILFQYLERVDKEALDLAKEVLKDCKRKHDNRDSKFATLAEAVNERVRNAVGESHWAQACQIQGQLVFNQRKKRVTMAVQRQRKNNGGQAGNGERRDGADHEHGMGNQGELKRSLVNADITVPRRSQLRRVKKRKKSRSPSSRSGGSSENSDSSYTSTSSLTTSGNEKGSSTSSTAPSTSSTNPSSSENDNTPRENQEDRMIESQERMCDNTPQESQDRMMEDQDRMIYTRESSSCRESSSDSSGDRGDSSS